MITVAGEIAAQAVALAQPVSIINTISLAAAVWGIKRFVTQVEKLACKMDASIEHNHRMHQRTLSMLHQVNQDVAILKYKAGLSTSFTEHDKPQL